MPKTLSGRIFQGAAGAAIALTVSLVATAPSFAASHHNRAVRYDAPAPYARSYYDFVPLSDTAAGRVGLRTNPAIVPPGAYGPPDPASCGGFNC